MFDTIKNLMLEDAVDGKFSVSDDKIKNSKFKDLQNTVMTTNKDGKDVVADNDSSTSIFELDYEDLDADGAIINSKVTDKEVEDNSSDEDIDADVADDLEEDELEEISDDEVEDVVNESLEDLIDEELDNIYFKDEDMLDEEFDSLFDDSKKEATDVVEPTDKEEDELEDENEEDGLLENKLEPFEYQGDNNMTLEESVLEYLLESENEAEDLLDEDTLFDYLLEDSDEECDEKDEEDEDDEALAEAALAYLLEDADEDDEDDEEELEEDALFESLLDLI